MFQRKPVSELKKPVTLLPPLSLKRCFEKKAREHDTSVNDWALKILARECQDCDGR